MRWMVIAKAAKGILSQEVPEDVIKYMRDNGILIDGLTIDEYMAKYMAIMGSAG